LLFCIGSLTRKRIYVWTAFKPAASNPLLAQLSLILFITWLRLLELRWFPIFSDLVGWEYYGRIFCRCSDGYSYFIEQNEIETAVVIENREHTKNTKKTQKITNYLRIAFQQYEGL
jgi:hypothetical protein